MKANKSSSYACLQSVPGVAVGAKSSKILIIYLFIFVQLVQKIPNKMFSNLQTSALRTTTTEVLIEANIWV